MTQWACEYRASEPAQRALQDFLCGWCFNFQSVWVNNVWLSVPLLALTISCLNLIAHRAWGSGWVARVWVWGFLYLHNGESQSPLSVNSGLSWSIKRCGQMKAFKAAPRALQKLLLLFLLLHPWDSARTSSTQGSECSWIRERKLTWEKRWVHTVSLDCHVYWVPFTQSCRRLGQSSPRRSRHSSWLLQ